MQILSKTTLKDKAYRLWQTLLWLLIVQQVQCSVEAYQSLREGTSERNSEELSGFWWKSRGMHRRIVPSKKIVLAVLVNLCVHFPTIYTGSSKTEVTIKLHNNGQLTPLRVLAKQWSNAQKYSGKITTGNKANAYCREQAQTNNWPTSYYGYQI